MNRTRLLALMPLVIFVALAGLFFIQLSRGGGTNVVPSALIGDAAPRIVLPALSDVTVDGAPVQGLDPANFQGRISLVNIWASWCGPCRQEHPILMELAQDSRLTLVGLNYKDQPVNARRFIGTLGNPYDAIGVDPTGRQSIEWGVYGVPETFLVDAQGVIRAKHVGPLLGTPTDPNSPSEQVFYTLMAELLSAAP